MGEASLLKQEKRLVIYASLFFYGHAASELLSRQIAADIASQWNAANGTVRFKEDTYQVAFEIEGHWTPALTEWMVYENTNPRNNYFRIEQFAYGNISFVDGIGSNTGYFLLENLLANSTTAAHEFGHTIGLEHPANLDIRGQGQPGIMYPRGTIVDPLYQYSQYALPHAPGGTINPLSRKVLQQDIDHLRLHKLRYNEQGLAMVGDFTSVWHEQNVPQL